MKTLDLNTFCRKFLLIFQKYINNDYFRNDFGVGPDESTFSTEKGKIGFNLEQSLRIELRMEIPSELNIDSITEEQIFSIILFLLDHIAKPGMEDATTDTGWNYMEFVGDYKVGKQEFQDDINHLLKNYKDGYKIDILRGIIPLHEGTKSTVEIQQAIKQIRLTPKKYQIFISSTLNDLKEERKEIIQRVLEMGHIPCGMEMFPASNKESWKLIQKTIRDCDYYVLISAGRYGSENEEGISYTELEYKFALEKEIPTASFLHENPESIPRNHTDGSDGAWEKLIQFRRFIKSQQNVRFWNNIGELATSLVVDIPKLISENPRDGWIRSKNLAEFISGRNQNDEALKIAELLEENVFLKTQIGNLKKECKNLESNRNKSEKKSEDNNFTETESAKFVSNIELICMKLKLILEDAATYAINIDQNEKLYGYLRCFLFSISDVSLPSFLLVCTNLREIFKLLQTSSPTYYGRRKIINSEIDTFLEQIRSGNFSVIDTGKMPYENLMMLWKSDNLFIEIENFLNSFSDRN